MNKDKLNLTTTLNVGGEGFLQGLEVVRSWYLCYTEPTEQLPFPSKTTSIKMYMDEEGVAYLAGDYIKGTNGEALMQFCQRVKQRDITIAHQSLQEKNVKVVIPKDPCQSGKLEWDRHSDYLVELGVEVVEAKGNRNLRLRKRFEPAEVAGFNILTDTFTNKDFLMVMQVLNQSGAGDMRRYGDEILHVISDAYNTLKFIKNEETKTKEKQSMNTGVKGIEGVKLHKTLQKVGLDSVGMFTQRITMAGYDLTDMDALLTHKSFVGNTDEIEHKLDEVGSFISRCCKVDGRSSVFTLEDLIALLDSKVEDVADVNIPLSGVDGGVKIKRYSSEFTTSIEKNKPKSLKEAMYYWWEKKQTENTYAITFKGVDGSKPTKQKATIKCSDEGKYGIDYVEGVPILEVPLHLLEEIVNNSEGVAAEMVNKLSKDLLDEKTTHIILPSDTYEYSIIFKGQEGK